MTPEEKDLEFYLKQLYKALDLPYPQTENK
jgi:hypothetical protein